MSDHPNILIIHADQHRYDCLGTYGNGDIHTPNIDALATDGVRYENSFCCFPVCTPSRYSLITGLYVHQHLGWTNHCTLPAGLPTLPRLLRDSGYRTKAVGKMHYTPTYLDVGFQEMELAEQDGPGRHDDDYHRWLREQDLCDRIDLMDQVRDYRQDAPQAYWDTFGALRSDLPEPYHSTTWIGDRAVETLEGWDGDENLLMAGFIKPHHPFDPPAPWDEMYDPAAISVLPGWSESVPPQDQTFSPGYFPNTSLTKSALQRVMAFYYATISQIDYHVGRMIDVLKQKGLYDQTLIVYTSDHGDYLGCHHLLLKGNHLYDPLAKVPLIVKYPHQAHAGQVDDRLVNNVDLAPTLLRCAGHEPPHTMAGQDLLASGTIRKVVFAEGIRARQYMARTHSHKLLLCREPSQSLFFDLKRDPFELENRIHDPVYQPVVSELTERLLRWSLFDAPSITHLDERAPVADAPNVPPVGGEHRSKSETYFRHKMSQDIHMEL